MVSPILAEVTPRIDDRRARYAAALELVGVIDHDLVYERGGYCVGRRIYRDKSGRLLTTLDDVVRAILAGNLMPFGEAAAWVQWGGEPS
jgi:hypothetical protein